MTDRAARLLNWREGKGELKFPQDPDSLGGLDFRVMVEDLFWLTENHPKKAEEYLYALYMAALEHGLQDSTREENSILPAS